ncbi:winged helix-turn-helix domain-containing protein [Lignipirellula cremea]|uniref:Winged helix-turn-helix domain-containing protein n=1 Tax=Lignipirellula cremea TaxID=2528010 RepID=A0A518DND6_9BACT|nr:winged helix-turn-helix domain-containing protein [Lignipirellula cremea]QDU93358.1 hypothetical protein Pla8534_11380 [Lignipirellula cremea]
MAAGTETTETTTTLLQQIGEAAGNVWQVLQDEGPTSLSKLVKQVDFPRDVVVAAMGWLAREDKLQVDETSRGRLISLREEQF